jgi:hypothetical protein
VDAAAAEERVRAIAVACDLGNAAVAANQILRVPGTMNLGARKGRPDARVRVVDYRPRHVYGLDAFAHLTAGPEPGIRATGRRVPLLPAADADRLYARACDDLSARMRALADGEERPRRDGAAYASPSEGDYALIAAFIRVALTGSEAATAFLGTRRGAACLRRHGRAEGTDLVRRWAANAEDAEPAPVPRIAVPRTLFAAAPRLHVSGIAVYLLHAMYAHSGGACWASHRRLADDLGVDESTVKRARRALCAERLLLRDGHEPTPDAAWETTPRYRVPATGEGGARISLATLRAAQERAGMDGLCAAAAIRAGHDTIAAIAAATETGRERAGRAAGRLVASRIVTVRREARGLQRFRIAA